MDNPADATLMVRRSPSSENTILRLSLYDADGGNAKEVPLRFVDLHGSPHILYAARRSPGWASLAVESRFVRWRVGSRAFLGIAKPVDDVAELQTKILPEYGARFGAERVSRWFGPEVGCIALAESPDGAPYHREVEALFDRSARTYDRVVRSNRFDMHLRTVAIEILRELFAPGQRVLELGCGTGLETIPLAEAGVHVVALDISSQMLEQLDRKARASSGGDRIETRKAAIADLPSIVSELGPGSFDGAFSHFGALNCEPQLELLPSALHQLIKPDGKLSLGIWNRTCLAEMILFSVGLRPARGLARLRPSVPVGNSRFGVPVFPLGPGEVKRLFSRFFSPERAVGASVFMPPYDLGRRLVPHPLLVSLLETGDRLVRGLPLFRYLGDHFLLELRRR